MKLNNINNNGKYQIVGANRTSQGWEFVAEPVHQEVKFICSSDKVEELAWHAMRYGLPFYIGFGSDGKCDCLPGLESCYCEANNEEEQ